MCNWFDWRRAAFSWNLPCLLICLFLSEKLGSFLWGNVFRLECRFVDSREICCEAVTWFELTQERVEWRSFFRIVCVSNSRISSADRVLTEWSQAVSQPASQVVRVLDCLMTRCPLHRMLASNWRMLSMRFVKYVEWSGNCLFQDTSGVFLDRLKKTTKYIKLDCIRAGIRNRDFLSMPTDLLIRGFAYAIQSGFCRHSSVGN